MFRNIYRIYLLILIFAPLAFGTVEPWSLTVMETLSFVSLLLYLLRETKKGESSLHDVPGIVPLLCLAAYYVLQLIPLPAGLVRFLSPETYGLYTSTVGIVEPVKWISLSIHKKATLQEFFRFAAYVAFYILTVQMLSRRELLKKTVATVILFSSGIAFLAILQYLFYNRKIFWLRDLPVAGFPFGPFVNRNHYAGFMEMVFPVALCVFLALKPRVEYESLREKLSELLGRRRANNYLLTGLASILIATSVFLSLSRGGILSLCVSMIFLGGLLIMNGINRRRGIVVIAIFVVIVFSVGWIGWGPVLERFEKTRDIHGEIKDARQTFWKDSMTIIKDYPVTGAGFGTFADLYPKYRTLQAEYLIDHAHNDYLEILIDGGVIAFLLTAWFFLTLLYRSYSRFLTRRESYSRYLFIGSITGMAAILIHSFTDFNLHIGSNGLYFFFLAGLTVSAANTRLREGLGRTYLRAIPSPPLRPLVFSAALILFASLVFNGGLLIGDFTYSFIKGLRLYGGIDEKTLLSMKDAAHRASLFDPLEPEYHYAVGKTEMALVQTKNAIVHYREAVDLSPLRGEYLQGMGLAYSTLRDADRAEKLLRAGITCDVADHRRYGTYAAWLFSQGRREEAMENIKTAISLAPNKTGGYITAMVLQGVSDEEMVNALPERVLPYLTFGDYLHRIGKEEPAEHAYRNALNCLGHEEVVNASFFYRVYEYYAKQGLSDEALKVMQQAMTYLPKDAGIRITTGAIYEKLGITHRALEEYRNALTIDPKNLQALGRLDALESRRK